MFEGILSNRIQEIKRLWHHHQQQQQQQQWQQQSDSTQKQLQTNIQGRLFFFSFFFLPTNKSFFRLLFLRNFRSFFVWFVFLQKKQKKKIQSICCSRECTWYLTRAAFSSFFLFVSLEITFVLRFQGSELLNAKSIFQGFENKIRTI